MNESTIVRTIQKRCQKAGLWAIKLHGGPMAAAGLPDLLIVGNGRVGFLEIKQEGGKLSNIQQHTVEKLKTQYGVAAGVAWSVDRAAEFVSEFLGVEI